MAARVKLVRVSMSRSQPNGIPRAMRQIAGVFAELEKARLGV